MKTARKQTVKSILRKMQRSKATAKRYTAAVAAKIIRGFDALEKSVLDNKMVLARSDNADIKALIEAVFENVGVYIDANANVRNEQFDSKYDSIVDIITTITSLGTKISASDTLFAIEVRRYHEGTFVVNYYTI